MSLYLKHYSFWFPALLFLIHQLLQHVLSLQLFWVDQYLDPFCFTATFLVLYQWQRDRWLSLQQPMMLTEVLAWLAVLSLLSEGLFPWLNPKFHADLYDIIPLFLGALWHVISRPKGRSESSLSKSEALNN